MTLRFFSTTTTLLRPCEKLWRTVPVSTGRFRCSVGFALPSDLSPLLFVSVMRCSSYPALFKFGFGLCDPRRKPGLDRLLCSGLARSVGDQPRDFGEEGGARRPRAQ